MTLGGAAMVLLPTFIIVRHTLPQPPKAAVNGSHSRWCKFRKADKTDFRRCGANDSFEFSGHKRSFPPMTITVEFCHFLPTWQQR